jgi:hypothetical protein
VEQKAHRRRSGAGAATSPIFAVAAGWEKASSAGRRAPGPPAPPPAAPRPQARPHRILGAPPAPDLGILGAPPAPNLGSSARSMYSAKAGHRLQRRWTTTSLMLAGEPPSPPTRYRRRPHLGSTASPPPSPTPASAAADPGSPAPPGSRLAVEGWGKASAAGRHRANFVAVDLFPAAPLQIQNNRRGWVRGWFRGAVGLRQGERNPRIA